MTNKWDKPDVPQKGWYCVDVLDVRPVLGPPEEAEYETCEMCGNHPIRFVHLMEHGKYEEQLRVGCICAEHMTDDYLNPAAREKRLKNKATRKRNWLSLKWKTSRKGNPYLKKDGMILTVFPNKFKPGFWKYGLDGEFGSESYATEEEAKLALFEEYWDELDA